MELGVYAPSKVKKKKGKKICGLSNSISNAVKSVSGSYP